ncbi:MAG: hypothetical protein ACI8XC_002883 [Gammaproteobacteria bacterium]|jgi:hypothetical protein
MGRMRIVGTVEEAVEIEEVALNRILPNSFKHWLLDNNGTDLDWLHIYPVRDERDTRKTWQSLVYNFENEWTECRKRFYKTDKIFSHLLPFADFGTGDYYCFDYSVEAKSSERPVVLWANETGCTELCAEDFDEFVEKVLSKDVRSG